MIRLSGSCCDSMWTKGLHTLSTVFSAGCSHEKKHFCFPSAELCKKTQADRFARPFQACPDVMVPVFTLRSRHYSPGAPKPMDVIRCPLTSMRSKSGDLTTHAPSLGLTWWKSHLELTADMQQPMFSSLWTIRHVLGAVIGFMSGKSAADKDRRLIYKSTLGAIRGSHCTFVQVS